MMDIPDYQLSDLQPSQFCISEQKLKAVRAWFTPSDLSGFEPIPVKILDGIPVMTDGHTRAVAALLAGLHHVPLIRDEDDLDWDMYRKCVAECRRRGITSPANLCGRILSEADYREKWDRWCDAMQMKVIQDRVVISECMPDEGILSALIRLSEDWEAENSCYGYRKNEKADIEGNRIFLASDRSSIVGYLFGHMEHAEKASSIMPDGTPFFELEELYVKPEYRNKGIGKRLFRFAEEAVSDESEFILLSTATKNRNAIFHFYLDELGMSFWSARLFRKLKADV